MKTVLKLNFDQIQVLNQMQYYQKWYFLKIMQWVDNLELLCLLVLKIHTFPGRPWHILFTGGFLCPTSVGPVFLVDLSLILTYWPYHLVRVNGEWSEKVKVKLKAPRGSGCQ